ncbi:hypothetical protein P3S68_029618 [Capsicum galapagoense]
MSFVYVTLRFHYGDKLQQKLCIKYRGGIVTNCVDVNVDRLSYFEFIDIVKEIGYNYCSCIVYLRPPKRKKLVIVTCDREILGILPQLKNEDVVELYLTHLVDEVDVVPSIEYDHHVGGESCPTFYKELSEDFGNCDNLGFEENFIEAAIPHEPTFSENLSGGGTARSEDLGGGDDVSSIGVAARGEDLGGSGGGGARSDDLGGVNDNSATGEDLSGVSACVNQNLGDTTFVTAANIPVIPSDWESETDVSEKSDYYDFFDEGEDDEYGSDVHEEVGILREQKKAAKKKEI